jgi:hypothetical protein
MASIQEIEMFQKESDRLLVQKTRNSSSSFTALLGLLNVVVSLSALFGALFGLTLFLSDSLLWIFLFPGIALLVQGIWKPIKPESFGLKVDGILLFCLAAVYLIMSVSAQSPTFIVFAAFGIAHAWWGYDTYQDFKRFSKIPSEEPNPKEVEFVHQALDSLRDVNVAESEKIIEFEMQGIGRKWKARLEKEMAILVRVGGFSKSVEEAYFVPKNNFLIKDLDRAGITRQREISVTLGEKRFRGRINPEQLQRYERIWKPSQS